MGGVQECQEVQPCKDLRVLGCPVHLQTLLQCQQRRTHMRKTLRRTSLRGKRSQKENRKSRRLPRSPRLQKSRKRRVGSQQCITTMRETPSRRIQSQKGSTT